MVGNVRFELTRSSHEFLRLAWLPLHQFPLAGVKGVEPLNFCFRDRWLYHLSTLQDWLGWVGSNHWMTESKSVALSLGYIPIYKSLGPGPHLILGFLTKARAALVNLKLRPHLLPLNEVKGQKARTLVRVSIFINGVPGRSRTRNLLVRSQILYPVELPGHVVDLMRLKLTTFPLRRERSLNWTTSPYRYFLLVDLTRLELATLTLPV